jgi:DNA-binding LytR/AlgR family response regulator
MDKSIKILIVEDEELGARKLAKLIGEIDPSITILGVTEGIASTVQWFEESVETPDLMLVDIELSDGQSFEIFSSIHVPCPVIFTTSYDEHALRAFKLNSVDYLLKPVKKEELEAALTKWKNNQPCQEQTPAPNDHLGRMIDHLVTMQSGEKYRSRFLVKQGTRFVPVFTDQIAYIYSSNKLTFIKTRNDQRYLVDYNLDDLGENLNPSDFFKANRQFILGTHCIREVHPWFNGKMKVMVQPAADEEVIISRERAREFRSWLGE